MSMMCVCGKEIDYTSATPWLSATMDSEGKVIRGVCLHGTEFDFEEFRMDEMVEILKRNISVGGDLWVGCKGKVRHKAVSGEIGVEIETTAFGLVTIWIRPEELKRVN